MSTESTRKVRAILITFLIGFAAGVAAPVFLLERYGYRFEKTAAAMPAQLPRQPRNESNYHQMGRTTEQTQPQTQQTMAAETDVEPGLIEVVLTTNGAVPPVDPVSPARIVDDVMELRLRQLLLPLSNLKTEALRDSFDESRGNRIHEAIDILAPRNTAILAVEDGSIARLWLSVPGGITIYQFDPEQKYEYYYAHLESYAYGLKEGDPVKRGQVIGYVGTSGNAPKDTPHLHFTIIKLTEQKRWWEGTAINPYLVY